METNGNPHQEPILKEAWLRHAELDANAGGLKKRYTRNRKRVYTLGIIATFLAIFTTGVSNLTVASFSDYNLPTAVTNILLSVQLEAILKVLLIATPLLASIIAAYTSREMGDGRWLAMRAGGEEITKDIYIYRTVLAKSPYRNRWLSNRLAVILRQVYKSSGNKLDTEPFTGSVPVHYYPDDPDSDSGFKDLTPDEYIRFRLLNQLKWHERKLVKIGKEKRNLTLAILGMGGLGALLAGIGEPFAVWVALTASITAAMTGWEELQNREATIANYSKVKLELTILKDHWYGLAETERTESEFYKMVLGAENLLWMQNSEYIRSMQEALASVEDEDARLVEDVIRESESLHQNLQESLYAETASVLAHTNEQLTAVVEDAGDSVESMVTSVSVEARAYTDSAENVVDAAVDESTAVRKHIEVTATTEIDAWGDSAEGVADAAAAESSQVRETAETAVTAEVEAWGDSAEQAIEGVSEESAAVRAAADTAVASETEAWGDTAQEAIESASATSEAAREIASSEVDAWEEDAQVAIDRAAETSATAREAALDEVDAWQESTENVIEEVSTESAAVRTSAETAATSEVNAWGDSAEQAIDTASAESAQIRASADATVAAETEAWSDTAQEAIDSAAETSAAARAAASDEVDAWQESTENAIDDISTESTAVRAAAETAMAHETEAWSDSAQTAIDTAVEQSEGLREVTDDAVDTAVAQSEAWQDSAQQAVDTVEAESEAWRATADNAIEAAAIESENAREGVNNSVKYALEFKPIIDNATDFVEDFHQSYEKVVYTAKPDVKFPISFDLTDAEEPAIEAEKKDDASSSVDDAVNEAVDRILQEGVNVADDAIKEALAKAKKDEEQ